MNKYTLATIFLLTNIVVFGQTPIANFNTADVCNGEIASFTDATLNTPTSWSWDFGDGGVSTLQNPTHTYSAPGVYAVKLVATNGAGSDSITQPISVFDIPSIGINEVSITCNGMADGSIEATPTGGLAPYTYIWDDAFSQTTANAINLPAGTYTVTVTDDNGCVATNNGTLLNPTAISVVVYDTAFCEGGTATLTPFVTGGTPSYTYSWSNGGATTQTLVDAPSVTTTYTLTVMDALGCTNDGSGTVTVDPMPIANSDAMSMCEVALGQAPFNLSLLNNSVNGGTGNTISWYEDAGLSLYISNPTSFVSGSTIVYADVESPQFCHNVAPVQLTVNDSTTNVVRGVVRFQGSPITNGMVRLIRKNGVLPSQMQVVGTSPVSVGGLYSFSGIPQGTYIVKAMGDTSLYNTTPTYSGGGHNWPSATEYTIVSNCEDTIQAVVDLMVMPINAGVGNIAGQLIIDDGTGLVNKAPGDPIPDIDITVEQSPGGSIMSATTTNLTGHFAIANLEPGNYKIHVEMLGYTMTANIMNFTGNGMNYDVKLCANDTFSVVDVCENVVTSINNIGNEKEVNIFPNPANDNLFINMKDEIFNIQVIDIEGRVILTKYNVTDRINLNVSNFSAGIYQVRLYNKKLNLFRKVAITR